MAVCVLQDCLSVARNKTAVWHHWNNFYTKNMQYEKTISTS